MSTTTSLVEVDRLRGGRPMTVYGKKEASVYGIVIDYKSDPVPPLAEADRGWAVELLCPARLR